MTTADADAPLELHPNGLHDTDNIVVRVVTDAHGFKHDITHCRYCGYEMSKPQKGQRLNG